MTRARAMAIVDGAPGLVFADSARRLTALGASAPRRTVLAVRDVLADTPVTAVALARDSLVFGAADGRVHVWSLATDELMADPEDQHSGPVTAAAAIWMPDLDILFALSGGRDGTFRLWAVPASASLLPIEDRAVPVTALAAAVTGVGPVAAVAWADGVVTLWDLAEARTGRPIPLGWTPTALTLGEDGLLVAAGPDGIVAIDVELDEYFED
jgi:WD40 repeat protein